MTLKGGFLTLQVLDKSGKMVEGSFVTGNAIFVPFHPKDQQFTLRVTYTGGMANPCDMRVRVADQVTGFRPMFDMEPHGELDLFVKPQFNRQEILVSASPIRRGEEDEQKSECEGYFQGPGQFRGTRAYPARPNWLELSANPELLVVIFLRK